MVTDKKQSLDEGFVISGIINDEVSVISRAEGTRERRCAVGREMG